MNIPSFECHMVVHLERVRENLSALCTHLAKRPDQIIAVVKDNAYGLGAVVIARTLQDAGVVHFAVARIAEAMLLREEGITGMILVLGMVDPSYYACAVEQNITLSLVDEAQIPLFEQALATHPLRIHLNIDTGMHRNGILASLLTEDNTITERIIALGTAIEGIYTHYHSATNDECSSVSVQHDCFVRVCETLANRGLSPLMVHSANSAASVYAETNAQELNRPGIALYGYRPDPEITPTVSLHEAATIISYVASVREIDAGEAVSYCHTWRSTTRTRIASVAIGYANGYPRVLLHSVFVLISGKKYPVVGRVTMDYIMIDIGLDALITVGDQVIVAGSDGDKEIPVDELAVAAGTIAYDLLCRFGASMEHRYTENGTVIAVRPRECF